MDREKLIEARSKFIRDNRALIGNNAPLVADAFDACAEAIMKMPLSERLTDAEIAKARAAYRRAEEGCNGNDDIEYAVGLVVKTVLNEIFGADLFKNK